MCKTSKCTGIKLMVSQKTHRESRAKVRLGSVSQSTSRVITFINSPSILLCVTSYISLPIFSLSHSAFSHSLVTAVSPSCAISPSVSLSCSLSLYFSLFPKVPITSIILCLSPRSFSTPPSYSPLLLQTWIAASLQWIVLSQ